jgi:hypothetical protein
MTMWSGSHNIALLLQTTLREGKTHPSSIELIARTVVMPEEP